MENSQSFQLWLPSSERVSITKDVWMFGSIENKSFRDTRSQNRSFIIDINLKGIVHSHQNITKQFFHSLVKRDQLEFELLLLLCRSSCDVVPQILWLYGAKAPFFVLDLTFFLFLFFKLSYIIRIFSWAL